MILFHKFFSNVEGAHAPLDSRLRGNDGLTNLGLNVGNVERRTAAKGTVLAITGKPQRLQSDLSRQITEKLLFSIF